MKLMKLMAVEPTYWNRLVRLRAELADESKPMTGDDRRTLAHRLTLLMEEFHLIDYKEE